METIREREMLNSLAGIAAVLRQMAGDLRAVRGLLEARAERTEFAEIVLRLKQRGVIPADFDASKLDAEVANG